MTMRQRPKAALRQRSRHDDDDGRGA